MNSIELADNSIVVLKGIPLGVVDSEHAIVDIERITKDKMGYYFMNIYNAKRKYISYEEFLLYLALVFN